MKKRNKSPLEVKKRKKPFLILIPVVLAVAVIVAISRNNSKIGKKIIPPADSPVQTSVFAETIPNQTRKLDEAPEGMVWIPGGEFSMGAEDPRSMDHGGDKAMEDARPIHRVSVDGFWMDRSEVTNAQFETFVKATGYVTFAERTPRAEDSPGVPQENLVAGSIVFAPPSHAVPLHNHYQWWGAGKRLPTEGEWEFAARGGLTGKVYTWGDEFRPNGKWMANIYQGQFPVREQNEDGTAGVAPVGQYPPNGYGLFDMAGNVWEWCSDWYQPDYYAQLLSTGTVARNPKGPDTSFDPEEPAEKKRVHRGGSFLCTEQYCTRYMIGTRGKGEITSATNHLGFRCVMSAKTQ